MNHSAASSTREEPIELVENNPAWPALALKHQLALQYRHDREGYTEAKGPFIAQVLAKM